MTGWDDLAALERHLWDRLARAAGDGADAWRHVALATAGPDGPEARTVALRAADRAAGTVEVHSDARTPKVAQIGADPRAQLLLWDETTGEQLRVSVRMEVARADPARWAAVPAEARGNYGTEPAPGTPIDGPDDFRREPARAKHAALVGRVTAMDAVMLATDPHRRARLEGGRWRWVAP